MIRHGRKTLNLTMSELAKRLDVSKSYVSKLENHPESCNPTINLILKIGKELNIDPIKISIYFIDSKKKLQ